MIYCSFGTLLQNYGFIGQQLPQHSDPDLVLQCFHDDDYFLIFLLEEPSCFEWPDSRVFKMYKSKEGLSETIEKSFFGGGRNIVTKFNSTPVIVV